jgi:hypothetical protein
VIRPLPDLRSDLIQTEFMGVPRCIERLAGKALQQLFQHMNGLSPTSQFSPSGGAGNAPTRGAGIPTWPSM